jgi:hypothetical protein
MVWLGVPPLDHARRFHGAFVASHWVLTAAMVWMLPGSHSKLTGAGKLALSTNTDNPGGSVTTVTPTARANCAVSDAGVPKEST